MALSKTHAVNACSRSRGGGFARRRAHAVREAVRDPVGGSLHRVPRKVGVACGRLDLAVAEELADHRQAFTEGESPGREGVSEVMESYVLEPGLATDHLPRCVQIGQPRAGPAPEDDPGIVGLSGHGGEHLFRRRRQRDGACSGLAVAQAELVVFEVDIFPSQGEDLVAPASGQHQKAECRGGAGRDPARAFELAEHGAQPHELLLRQEALATSHRILLDEPAGIASGRCTTRGHGTLEEPGEQ